MSRQERYRLYFQQLQCLYVRLDDLFQRMQAAGIYDNSIIVLHGDHGSRIVMAEPISVNRHTLNEQDLIDAFSTLFAVKLPGVPGGYDTSPSPLERLLADVVAETSASAVTSASEQSEPFVYLKAGNRKKLLRIPYLVAQR